MRDTHPFLLSSSIAIHLLGWVFLRELACQNFFLSNGQTILESSCGKHRSHSGEYSDPGHLLFAPFLPPLSLPLGTQITCPFRISSHPLWGQHLQLIVAESTVHLPSGFKQLSAQNKSIPLSFKHIVQNFRAQGLVPFAGPCKSPILSVGKPSGRGWRFLQNAGPPGNNSTAVPAQPVVPPPHANDIHSH